MKARRIAGRVLFYLLVLCIIVYTVFPLLGHRVVAEGRIGVV